MSKILNINSLSIAFDEPIFGDLNFDLQLGQALHIKGENGSGKTTLLQCLLGLLPANGGTITWFEESLAEFKSWLGYKVQYLSTDLALKKDLTVEENLQMLLRASVNQFQNKPIASQDLQEALAQFGLQGMGQKLMRQLSSGQQRRLALSQFVFSDAQVWVLDEPFANLDDHALKVMKQLIEAHVNNNGAVIFTSHQAVSLNVTTQVLEL